jgi:hypothetical protein
MFGDDPSQVFHGGLPDRGPRADRKARAENRRVSNGTQSTPAGSHKRLHVAHITAVSRVTAILR